MIITKRFQNKGDQRYLHKVEIKNIKKIAKRVTKIYFQVKEKIPETWERLSYLMDHNEERSADPGLWGTYR